MKIKTIGFPFNPKGYWNAVTNAPKFPELKKMLTDAGASSVNPIQGSGGWRSLEYHAKLIACFDDLSLTKKTVNQWLVNGQLDKFWSVFNGLTVSGEDDAGASFNHSLLLSATPQSVKIYISNGANRYPTGVCISGNVFPPKKLDKTLNFIFDQIRPQLIEFAQAEMSVYIAQFDKKLNKVKAHAQRVEDLLSKNKLTPVINSAPTVAPKSIWD